MEKIRFKKMVSAMACFLLCLLAFCLQKSENALSSDDAQAARDQARYESYLYDADDMVDLALSAQKEFTAKSKNEAILPTDDRFLCGTALAITITFKDDNSDETPHGILSIDFGEACEAKGKTRKGKISAEFKGKQFAKNSYVKYTFEQYAIQDGNHKVTLEGERQMTVTQITESNGLLTVAMSISLKNGKAIWADNTFMTLSTQQVRKWTHNKEHPNDDQWLITGSSSGATRGKKSFSSFISEPLLYSMKCIRSDIKMYLPVQGKMNLTIDNDPAITFDFGSGACDPQYAISKNGVTIAVNQKEN